MHLFRKLQIGALVAGLSIGGWLVWSSDERRIKACVHDAAQGASAAAGESEMQRVLRLAGLAKHLTTDITVEAEPGGLSVRGRETVVGLAGQLAGAGPQTIDISGLTVAIDPSGTRAIVVGLVRITSAVRGAAAAYDGQEIRFELVKTDGTWLISRAAPEPALSR